MRTQEDRATKLTASRHSAALDVQFSFVKDSVTGLIFNSPGGQNTTGTEIK